MISSRSAADRVREIVASPRRHVFWTFAWHLWGLFSLALSNIALGMTLLLLPWGETRAFWTRNQRRLLPLAVYGLGLLVSVFYSDDRSTSLPALTEFMNLTTFPLALWLVCGEPRTRRLVDGLGAMGAIVAVAGLAQFFLGFGDIDRRIRGPFSHYMTFSGVLLLCGLLLLGRLATGGWRSPWRWTALLLVGWAILGSLTRGAWIAAGVALALLLVLRRPRWLFWSAPVLALMVLVLPVPWIGRALSIGDLSDSSNYDRLCMARAGVRMITERPFFGIGPKLVRHRYSFYREETAPRFEVPHLHNSYLQLAAERGLVSLAAWLWFLVATLREAARGLRRGDRFADLHLGALLGVVAFCVAALFENNWGDTEVQRVFLFLAALPFVATDLAKEPPPRDQTVEPSLETA